MSLAHIYVPVDLVATPKLALFPQHSPCPPPAPNSNYSTSLYGTLSSPTDGPYLGLSYSDQSYLMAHNLTTTLPTPTHNGYHP